MKKETEEKEGFWTYNKVLFSVGGVLALMAGLAIHDLTTSFDKHLRDRKACKVECLDSIEDKEGKKDCVEECEVHYSFY